MYANNSSLVIGFLFFIIDRVFKFLSRAYVTRGDLGFFNGIVRFTYTKNPGAAFGFFPFQRGVIILVSLVALIFVIRLLKRAEPVDVHFIYGVWILVAGIVGNLVDRIFLGYVIDYFQILNSPIFNVSDIAILIGMAIILFSS
ncbi:MAG: signal peptidase II [bacterium]